LSHAVVMGALHRIAAHRIVVAIAVAIPTAIAVTIQGSTSSVMLILQLKFGCSNSVAHF
jgi:hypothetical protein